jgi:hypothetical protein
LVAEVDGPLVDERGDARGECFVGDGKRILAGQVLSERDAACAEGSQQVSQDRVDLSQDLTVTVV